MCHHLYDFHEYHDLDVTKAQNSSLRNTLSIFLHNYSRTFYLVVLIFYRRARLATGTTSAACTINYRLSLACHFCNLNSTSLTL